jgi:hypothetical protein
MDYRAHLQMTHNVPLVYRRFRFKTTAEFKEAREYWSSLYCVQFVQHGRPRNCNDYSAQMYYCSRSLMTKRLRNQDVDVIKRIPIVSKKSDIVCTLFMQVCVFTAYIILFTLFK